MTSPAVLGSDFDALIGRCDQALADFLHQQSGPWQDTAVAALTDVIGRFVLDGGKRLRPALCYWGWRGTGSPERPEIVVAAAALELVHAFALIHDDIMDASDQRRGRPAVRTYFADLHSRHRRSGDSRRHGDNAALLAGDLCAAWADQMFTCCGLPTEHVHTGHRILSMMRTEMIAGQFLDLQSAGGPTTADRAMHTVILKSARYTVTRPLQIGAALAGAGQDTLDAAARFGDPLGIAFQLRDDLLGVFGDSQITGKPALDDLREGKQTLLIVTARQAADPRQLARLDQLFGRADLDEHDATQIRWIIEQTGARRRVEHLIEQHHRSALHELAGAPITPEARHALTALADRLTRRDN